MKGLRARALIGSAWTVFGFGSQKLIQLASNLILTRLLFPEAFGLMALSYVILIGLGLFSDIGIKPSIVQHRDGDTIDFLNTAWTVQIIRGFAVWCVACMLAYPAAILYKQPILFPLICVLGATATINGFSTTALALREKRVDFSRIVLVQTAGSLVSLSVTAALAWALHSVWSLAFGALTGAAVNVLIGFIMIPSHPHHFRLERSALRSMLSFGHWILYSTIATYLGGHGLRAIQGTFIPIATFGVLSIAQMMAWMPGELVSQLLSTVGFASLAEARTKGGLFARAVHRLRVASLSLGIPMFFLVALVSDLIIHFLYDNRYHEAARYLPLLTLAGAIGIIPIGYQNAMLALGNSRLHFWIMLHVAIARILGVSAGYWAGGLYGMLIGDTVAIASVYPIAAMIASRLGFFDPACDALAMIAIAIGWTVVPALGGWTIIPS